MKALSAGASIATSVVRFCLMFFGSAGIGIVTALVSALVCEIGIRFCIGKWETCFTFVVAEIRQPAQYTIAGIWIYTSFRLLAVRTGGGAKLVR